MKVKNFEQERPNTSYHDEIVKSNLPPIDRFLSYLSTYGTYENNLPEDWIIPIEDTFYSGMLYKCFENWCKYRQWDSVF